MPLPGDRRRRRTSILSPIACPPPSTVTTMTNITLGAQCIGLYECPLRKRRKTKRWRIAVERHERAWKEEAGGKQWRALRFYYVILLMQRARRKERGGPRARAPRMSGHEKYYVPWSENEPWNLFMPSAFCDAIPRTRRISPMRLPHRGITSRFKQRKAAYNGIRDI